MKKIWDEIGVFPVTEQRLAEEARQVRTNTLLTDIDIEEIRMKLKRKNSKVEVQQNVQEIIEIIEYNGNKQVEQKRDGHKRSWLNKDMRMSSSRKHTVFVHFQKMIKH